MSSVVSEVLGRHYHDGDVIIRQGEPGDCMFVIQEGRVEVLQRKGGKEYCLAVLDPGDFFGEMALFEQEVRCATVRALGDVCVLTVDKRIFMQRMHEDASFAFKILKRMVHRLREMERVLTELADTDRFELSSCEPTAWRVGAGHKPTT